MKPLLHTAANGHLMICFEDQASTAWFVAQNYLELNLGFARSGQAIIGAGEGIYPSFSRGQVEISAGWDTWSGDYLLASCWAGDEVLRQVFACVNPH